MKKILIIAMVSMIFASCTSKKIQIFNNRTQDNVVVESLDGSMYDVAIFFFDEKDRMIKSITVGDIAPFSYSEKFDAAENAAYFKAEWGLVKDAEETYGKSFRVRSSEYTLISDGLSVFELSDHSKILPLK